MKDISVLASVVIKETNARCFTRKGRCGYLSLSLDQDRRGGALVADFAYCNLFQKELGWDGHRLTACFEAARLAAETREGERCFKPMKNL